MIQKNADYIRDEIVEELVLRMIGAINEVEDEHEYISTNEIILAGSRIGFMVSGGEG